MCLAARVSDVLIPEGMTACFVVVESLPLIPGASGLGDAATLGSVTSVLRSEAILLRVKRGVRVGRMQSSDFGRSARTRSGSRSSNEVSGSSRSVSYGHGSVGGGGVTGDLVSLGNGAFQLLLRVELPIVEVSALDGTCEHVGARKAASVASRSLSSALPSEAGVRVGDGHSVMSGASGGYDPPTLPMLHSGNGRSGGGGGGNGGGGSSALDVSTEVVTGEDGDSVLASIGAVDPLESSTGGVVGHNRGVVPKSRRAVSAEERGPRSPKLASRGLTSSTIATNRTPTALSIAVPDDGYGML